jgi:fermentation-respiration switch protein FrsA (DUF1100 family)
MTETPVPIKRYRARRVLVWSGFSLLAAYLAILIMLMWFETQMVYLASTAEQSWNNPPAETSWQDIDLVSSDGAKIHAWWCPHDGADGALLFCHGNGGNLSHRGPFIQHLQKVYNVSVLIFDYPGYGKSDGSPTEAGCYAAAEAAHTWLTRTKDDPVPPERVHLWGESLGGGVAIELASKHPYRALFLVRTFTSLPDVGQRMYPWLPVRWVMRNRFDNLSKLPRCKGPVMFTHGDADELVPFRQAERLYEAAPEPKYFYLQEGADHNTPFPEEFFLKAKAFLDEVESDRNG